jgi:hypothetical protein
LSGEAYVVFEPTDPAADLQRRAVGLGPASTLIYAENMASDFNEGAPWPLNIGPDAVLIGNKIPRLCTGSEGAPTAPSGSTAATT